MRSRVFAWLTFSTVSLAFAVHAIAGFPKTLIHFRTMYGVDAGFLNKDIQGLPGDFAPWVSPSFVEGTVLSDGLVSIKVAGLVLERSGKNPDPTFRGAVSCVTEEGETSTKVVVTFTREFSANMAGEAFIFDKITLPNPCAAPIVFIANPKNDFRKKDVWFSISGNENDTADDD